MVRSRIDTIGDVAALAGVSVATVLKALNSRRSPRADTMTQVHKATGRPGFVVNATAQPACRAYARRPA